MDETAKQDEDVYAGFWRRAAAAFVDTMVLTLASMLIMVAGSNPFGLVVSLAMLVYFPAMESSSLQATLGKLLVGIYVTNADGERTSFWRAFGRNLAKIVSSLLLYLGFVMAAFTEHKQALHDKMASCLVMRRGDASMRRAMGALAGSVAVIVAAGSLFKTQIKDSMTPEMLAEIRGTDAPAVKPAAPAPTAKPAAAVPATPQPQPVPAQSSPSVKSDAVAKPADGAGITPQAVAVAAPAATAAVSKPEKGAPVAAPVPAVAAAATSVATDAKPLVLASRASKRSRANEDARECLALSANAEIIKCAEKFR